MDPETNPYEAPRVALSEPRASVGLRPRLIPAVACYGVGFACLVGFAVVGFLVARGAYQEYAGGATGGPPAPLRPSARHLVGLFSGLMIGVLGVLGGRAWLDGHWWRAAELTTVLLLIAFGLALMQPFP